MALLGDQLPRRIYPTRDVERLYRDLLRVQLGEGGGASVADPPAALTVGGSASNGTATTAARTDHVHAITNPKLDDLATPDDNTDLDATTGRHGLLPKLGGGTTNFLRADGTWAAPGGGGGADWFDGQGVPSGLHAHSDEFTTDTSANWTDWDHGAWLTTTWSTSSKSLVLSGTASSSHRCGGVYKAIPSNEFTFAAKVAIHGPCVTTTGSASGWLAGLFFANDASSSSSAFRTVEHIRNLSSLGLLGERSWTNYTTPGAFTSRFGNTAFAGNVYWLRYRISISGGITTYAGDASVDGESWFALASGTIGYAAAHYGVFMSGNENTVTVQARFEHFRVWDGVSGFFDTDFNGA